MLVFRHIHTINSENQIGVKELIQYEVVNQSGETLSRARGKERKEMYFYYIALQGKDILF